MIFQFNSNEVAEILKQHVRETYNLESNTPVDIDFSIRKRVFFGPVLDLVSVKVTPLKK